MSSGTRRTVLLRDDGGSVTGTLSGLALFWRSVFVAVSAAANVAGCGGDGTRGAVVGAAVLAEVDFVVFSDGERRFLEVAVMRVSSSPACFGSGTEGCDAADWALYNCASGCAPSSSS